MHQLADEIKAIRKQLGYSQATLAALIPDCNRQKIADYENNRSRLPADIYLKIKELAGGVKRTKGRGANPGRNNTSC